MKYYFMIGEELPGHKMGYGASFSWFPIQTPESWDYLFEHVVKNSKEFEDRFYFQFEDLSDRALSPVEELVMWDYFAGDEFKPLITSRVPVGKNGSVVNFNVDFEGVAARFIRYLDAWVVGKTSDNPKWRQRINYFLTFFPQMPDEHFKERDSDGDFSTRGGRCIERVFNCLAHPEYDLSSLSEDSGKIRKDFINELCKKVDKVEMQPLMRGCWESVKAKKS